MLKKLLMLIFLVSLSLNMCGCAGLFLAGGAVAGGLGTARWLSTKIVEEVDTPFEETTEAVRLALDSLGLDIVREINKVKLTQIKSHNIDGRTVWIDIHAVSPSSSRVEVRVGAVSDKEAARKILDSIKEHL